MSIGEAGVDPLAHERALIERAQRGDGLAFRQLVEPHLRMLQRIATRVSGSSALAEDAVQETLALSFRRLGSFQQRASFRAFLAAIVSRQAFTLARSERRRGKREQSALPARSAATPEQQLDAALAARRVRKALMSMPPKRRDAALMRLDGGLSYREIAEALGSTEGSARVMVHNALKQLKERLAEMRSA